jgi:hypothetical protein
MSIYRYELKKLLFSPALLVFIVLCLGFNTIISADGWYYDYSDYVVEASRTTGYRLGTEFEKKTAGLDQSEMRDLLAEDTTGAIDIFDGYETAYIAEAYIRGLGLDGYAADAMREKYAKLQLSVDAKAATDESMTLYFAGATTYKHEGLHENTMLFLLLECVLLAALVVLMSVGYEFQNRTAHTVYATKTGRNIMFHKLFASLTAGLVAFTVLTSLTLALYFAFNDYGNMWGSSVSSVFHYLNDILAGGMRPFVTWQSYTVLTYLLATLGVSALLILCFAFMAFTVGILVKNSYIGFMIFLIINGGCVVFSFIVTGLPQYIAVLSPVWLWLQRGLWFTDGGSSILWKNFEMLGVSAAFVILAVLCAVSIVFFRKRDIA